MSKRFVTVLACVTGVTLMSAGAMALKRGDFEIAAARSQALEEKSESEVTPVSCLPAPLAGNETYTLYIVGYPAGLSLQWVHVADHELAGVVTLQADDLVDLGRHLDRSGYRFESLTHIRSLGNLGRVTGEVSPLEWSGPEVRLAGDDTSQLTIMLGPRAAPTVFRLTPEAAQSLLVTVATVLARQPFYM